MAQTVQPTSHALVGLTGGIGAGKSTVAAIIRGLHPVLDSDSMAADIIDTDPEIRSRLTEAFGRKIWLTTGGLDRSTFADLVFNDPAALRRLNTIVHPPTLRRIEQEAAVLAAAGHEIIFVESAILFEEKLTDRFDIIVTVLADPELAVRRVTAARAQSESQVRQRMARQMDDKVKAGQSDFVIHNNGTIEELTSRVMFVVSMIRRLCSIPL